MSWVNRLRVRNSDVVSSDAMSPASGPASLPPSPMEQPTPPSIHFNLFMGFLWGGVAIAAVFLAGRLFARIRALRRLHVDDFCISLAFALMLVSAGVWQWGAKDMYHILNANAGLEKIGPDFGTRMHNFLIANLIVELFFYTTLIMFKLSLLFFFRRLGDKTGKFMYFWWATLIFSVCTYIAAIGNVHYKCKFGTVEEITVRCNSPSGTHFLRATLNANCALDVLSDFLIMLFPIFLLWNIQIPLGKKIALIGIFSLSIITMAIAIARAAAIGATQKSNGLPDSSYLWFWSNIQSCLCIVVSCAAAFRQLFIGSNRPNNNQAWKPTDSYYKRLMSNFKSKRRPTPRGETDLFDLSTGGKTVDETTVHEASKAASQHSTTSLVLLPSRMKPVATCRGEPHDGQARGNEIIKEVGYRVTERAR
ncbi:hypothetical protein HIM_02299 [Hirsutella minnesotensis 3608]|nr:hypothetical protein HIM_02299 [Hirsutella minnesotensis 3608]